MVSKRTKIVFACVLVILLLIASVSLLAPRPKRVTNDVYNMDRISINLIEDALLDFHKKYGAFPSEDVGIANALMGNNQDGIVFMKWIASHINAKGQLLDFYDVPFKIEFEEQEVRISAAGPNGLFDDEDDIHPGPMIGAKQ